MNIANNRRDRITGMADAINDIRQVKDTVTNRDLIQQGFSPLEVEQLGDAALAEATRHDQQTAEVA